jgi:hypothetical protein
VPMRTPQSRVSSPRAGCSTLMTSAPRSASAIAHIGPASTRDRSSTRTPASGSDAMFSCFIDCVSPRPDLCLQGGPVFFTSGDCPYVPNA